MVTENKTGIASLAMQTASFILEKTIKAIPGLLNKQREWGQFLFIEGGHLIIFTGKVTGKLIKHILQAPIYKLFCKYPYHTKN